MAEGSFKAFQIARRKERVPFGGAVTNANFDRLNQRIRRAVISLHRLHLEWSQSGAVEKGYHGKLQEREILPGVRDPLATAEAASMRNAARHAQGPRNLVAPATWKDAMTSGGHGRMGPSRKSKAAALRRAKAAGLGEQVGALRIYMAMNERQLESSGTAPLTTRAIEARKKWVDMVTIILENDVSDLLTLVRRSNSLQAENMDEHVFYLTWQALLLQSGPDGPKGEKTNGLDEVLSRMRADPDGLGKTLGYDFERDVLTGLVSAATARRDREAAAQRAATAVKFRKELNDTSFKEQHLLMAKMLQLVENNQDHQYKFFSYVRAHPSGRSLESHVRWFEGQDQFENITNAQISALVPYFKLSIVYGKEDFEIPFQGTHVDIKDLLATGRARNLGFQSFEWTYEGKYANTVKKLIESKLVLYGDNLGVFDKTIGIARASTPAVVTDMWRTAVSAFGGGQETKAFVDKDFDPRHIKLADILTRERGLSFKAECGWAIPPASGIISKELRQALAASRITLLMEVVEHTFDFQQDGTFTLNLRFKSRIDETMSRIDLLKATDTEIHPEEQMLAVLGTEGLEKVFRGLTRTDKQSQDFKTEPITPQQIAAFVDRNFEEKRRDGAIRALGRFLSSAEIGNRKTRAAQAVNAMLLIKNRTNRTGKNFSRIMTKIEENDRIFYLSLGAGEFNQYFAEMAAIREGKRPTAAPASPATPAPSAAPTLPSPASPKVIAKSATVNKQGDQHFFRRLTASELNDLGRNETNFKLPFVYFGDLIEAALDLSKEQVENMRFILGTMPYRDPFDMSKNPDVHMIPLVDVPISLRNYGAWIHRDFNQKPSNKMELARFIVDAFNNLVQPVFSGAGDAVDLLPQQKSNIAINMTNFSSDRSIDIGEVGLESMKRLAISSNLKPAVKDIKNYSLFSSNKSIVSKDDPKIRLALGRDRGILKQATFSKMQMKNLVAARFAAESGRNDSLDKIKEPYNVDLEMVGNTLFMNGVNFFLTPTVPGVEGQRIARQLGLGGDYVCVAATNTINQEGFTTTLRGINQAFEATPEQIKAVAKGAAELALRAAEHRRNKGLSQTPKSPNSGTKGN